MKTEAQIIARVDELAAKLDEMDTTKNYERWQDYQDEQYILYWVLSD